MSLQLDLELTADFLPDSVSNLTKHIGLQWVDEALTLSGVATLRKRRLPMEQVIWLVLGMCLMRNRTIEDVVAKLDLALPAKPKKPSGPVAQSCISDARQHLGAEPMRRLFGQTASVWAHAENDRYKWRDLSLYGVDGSTLPVADTRENRVHFGGQTNGPTQSTSGYPIVRVVVLLALRSRLIAAARIGPYVGSSELSLTDDLLDDVPDNSLFIADRNFLNGRTILPLRSKGANRHVLMRAKKSTVMEPIRKLGRNDSIVELRTSAEMRKKDPSLGKTWQARAIRYQLAGFEPQFLLTTLLDPVAYPAAELVELYHERWDIELGFAEIKTTQLEQRPALRSKLPELVQQEVWGVLLAYNLVRLEMAALALDAKVMPNRISYVAALRLVTDEWIWSEITKPGAIAARLAAMRANLATFVLRPRRPERSYPRTVKNRTKPYPAKKTRAAAAVSPEIGA